MDDHDSRPDWSLDGTALSRRGFVKAAGAGGIAVLGADLLAACGSSSSGGGSSTAGTTAGTSAANTSADPFAGHAGTGGTPRMGGTLRVAMTGNGTAENYNPFITSTPIDTIHTSSVYDPMTRPAPFYGRAPGLVTEWNSNSDATVWELKLRQGVTWHDGKPLTADDLIYTLRMMAAPSSLGAYAVADVKLKDLKKLDAHTVQVPLSRAIADLQGYFFYTNTTFVVQDGTKGFSKPIGTGPFKLDSFTPGQRSDLSANRDYWDSPKPYADKLVVISIDDANARLNALTSGAVDIAVGLSFAQANGNLHNPAYKVIIGQAGISNLIYMRVDVAPFTDVRVREAMKLIPNRPQLVASALSGIGAVGNDLESVGTKYYDKSIPQRVQDIEKAKSLLKSAGASDLHLTLHTSEVYPGVTEAATVFAQQAAAAGVTIQVKVEQPSQYFNPEFFYTKEAFAQDVWPGPSLLNNYSQQFITGSPLNETHFSDPAFDALFYKAQAETNEAKAQDLWNQVQRYQYDKGGAIVWGLTRSADAVSNQVRGYGAPGSGWLYSSDDDRVWNWGLA